MTIKDEETAEENKDGHRAPQSAASENLPDDDDEEEENYQHQPREAGEEADIEKPKEEDISRKSAACDDVEEIESVPEEDRKSLEKDTTEDGQKETDGLKNGQEIGKDAMEAPPEVKFSRPSGLRGFIQRLFRKPKDIDDEKTRDPEAGVELLHKKPLSGLGTHSEKEKDLKGITTDQSDETAVTAEVGDPQKKKTWLARLSRHRSIIAVVLASLLVFLIIALVIGVLSLAGDKAKDLFGSARYVTVKTTCGPVEGKVVDGALAFLGVPYAIPPVGPRRWKPSEMPRTASECWNGTYKAHEPAKLCYQKPLPHPYGDLEFSEDCLYVDVYTPRLAYEVPLSVVVYFAGDSFMGHDAMDFGWRPSARLAKEKNVVFVVVYYRMNAFGFLALELLTNNARPPSSGNYGFHDMLTALKWVNLNVDEFGGDRTKVTVFGHGSGATGILALLSSSSAQMLFTQAWIAGGSANFVNKTLREVERNNEAFNRHLMCDTVECLYNKTAEEVLAAIPTSEWPRWGVPNHLELPMFDDHTAAVAVIDGNILYENPRTIWDEGNFVDVTLMVGSSLHAVGSQLLDSDLEDSWEWFNKTVSKRLGSFSAKIADESIERYYRDNGSAVEQYVHLLSDLRVTCPLLDLAYRASKTFSNHVYFYVASHVPDGVVNQMGLSQRLAVHGLDVAAIFGLVSEMLANPSERDLQFQAAMQKAFYQFVEDGRIEPDKYTCNSVGCEQSVVHTPKIPWRINWIREQIEASEERYPNYDFWMSTGIIPSFARMN